MIMGMVLAVLVQTQTPAPAAHEYTDLQQVKLSQVLGGYVAANSVTNERQKELKELFQFRDFVGKAIDGRSVNFHLKREKGYKPAKVLILTYTAEWCPNCNYEAPYLNELYKKYQSRGLEIVARSEYSEVDKVKAMMAKHQTTYPLIVGSVIAYSEREKIRLETFQYLLRMALGDKRKWGTPFSLIVINGDLDNPYVVLGEMKSEQVNDLIERSLGPSKTN